MNGPLFDVLAAETAPGNPNVLAVTVETRDGWESRVFSGPRLVWSRQWRSKKSAGDGHGWIIRQMGEGCDPARLVVPDCLVCGDDGFVQHPHWGGRFCPDDRVACPACTPAWRKSRAV
jgi:hypothetical protein